MFKNFIKFTILLLLTLETNQQTTFSIQSSPNTVGATFTSYLFQITSANPSIPSNGIIEITFPSDFTIN